MADEIKNIDDLISLINENKIVKFKAKVIAGSKINKLEFLEDFIKIKIKQKAIEGKANKAIIDYLSETLNIPKSKIEIITGLTSSLKTIQIRL